MNSLAPMEIKSLDQSKLKQLANVKSQEIMQRISAVSQRIAEAKEDAKRAENMDSGWFGKTGKKADATANALVRTNEAIAEMNELIQESVRFTCTTVDFSKAVHQAMSKMVVEGFRDRDGELIKLNQSGQEFASLIVDEAEEFAARQEQIEELQSKQAEQVAGLKEESKQRAIQLSRDIEDLKAKGKDHAAHLKELVEQRSKSILSRSDENDARHERLIGELQSATGTMQEKSDANDELHANLIMELQQKVIEHAERIHLLENPPRIQSHIYVAYAAVALSTVAIMSVGYVLFGVSV